RGADSYPDRAEEGAAGPRLAFEPDTPAHQLDQPAADSETEPGAAVLARGAHVGLGERLEDLRGLLFGHADSGVLHRELQLHLFPGAFQQIDIEPDLALLGEFDGVIDEVRQN